MDNRTRLIWVDLLKGIAILLVVLVHFNQAFVAPVPIISRMTSVGARGPQLFFIISAFLTWSSLSKSKGVSFQGSVSFIWGRVLRIAPSYYFGLFLAVLLYFVGFHYPKELGGVWGWLTHMLFINGFFPSWCNNILHVEWFIADLVIFYVISPFIKVAIKDLRQAIVFSLICTLISIVFLSFIKSLDVSASYDYFHTYCFIIQLPVFSFGIVLYYLLKDSDSSCREYLSVSLLSLVLFAGGVVDLFFGAGIVSSSLLAGLLFFWICYSISFVEKRGRINQKFFHLLPLYGRYSLGIYLFHMFLIEFLLTFPIIKSITSGIIGWGLIFLGVSIASLGIGIITNKLSIKI